MIIVIAIKIKNRFLLKMALFGIKHYRKKNSSERIMSQNALNGARIYVIITLGNFSAKNK